MRCSEVRERLVAWRDGELGRSEQEQVEDHLLGCSGCAREDRRLVDARPRPGRLAPPAAVRARMLDRLDADRLLALADQREPAPVERRAEVPRIGSLDWLRAQLGRPAPVSRGAALVYLMLLAGTFGWALSSWWSVPTTASPAPAGGAIPA